MSSPSPLIIFWSTSIKTDQSLTVFIKVVFKVLLAVLSSKSIETEILHRGLRLFESNKKESGAVKDSVEKSSCDQQIG